MDGRQECRQLVRDGLLHLVTCEAARDENAIEKFIRIDVPHACKPGEGMHIEPVAAVHHGNGIAIRHCMRCHLERQLKDRVCAVQEKYLA